jgi:hypothetical protein
MKSNKLIIFILVVFLQTGNVLSNNNIFNVNNIEIKKRGKTTNDILANQAIEKGFRKLISKILLEEDIKKLTVLKFTEIKELVDYYQVSDKTNNLINIEKINYNISFNKEKIHNLFYKKGVSYSEINNKELYILPILKKKNNIFIYNKNFFYKNWNLIEDNELIEFILPLENIEVIQKINLSKNNLLNLELSNLFTEYSNKNLALVLIEDNNFNVEKIYLKTKIADKNIIKKIDVKRSSLDKKAFYSKIINVVNQEIVNIVKSQNLIDIRVPSFLNAKLIITKNSNLVELNSRLNKIDLIEKIYVQEFNKEFILLKIKYLGKLEKIIRKLKEEKIILKIINEKWNIKIL